MSSPIEISCYCPVRAVVETDVMRKPSTLLVAGGLLAARRTSRPDSRTSRRSMLTMSTGILTALLLAAGINPKVAQAEPFQQREDIRLGTHFLVNRDRLDEGLPRLENVFDNPETFEYQHYANERARAQSDLSKGLDHGNRDGFSAIQRMMIERGGLPAAEAKKWFENLARISFAAAIRAKIDPETISAKTFHYALMRSDGHRSNILNPKFDQMGVGVWFTGDAWVLAQIFHHQV